MKRVDPALVLTLAAHGEHGAVGRFLSAEDGLVVAYVHGGRSRKLRPVLQAGNRVALDLQARAGGAMPVAGVHLLASNMAMLHGALAIALIEYLSIAAATLLPEGEPQPRLFPLFDALFAAAGAGADAATLGAALVRLELAMLAELGLGLDLGSCAATGSREDLAFVSPKSRQAVSRTAGAPWAARLLPLPAFLRDGGAGDAESVADGLRLSGHFLARDVWVRTGPASRAAGARDRVAALITAALPAPLAGQPAGG